MRFIVDGHQLKAAAMFASTDLARPTICQVAVVLKHDKKAKHDNEGWTVDHIAATDSYAAVIVDPHRVTPHEITSNANKVDTTFSITGEALKLIHANEYFNRDVKVDHYRTVLIEAVAIRALKLNGRKYTPVVVEVNGEDINECTMTVLDIGGHDRLSVEALVNSGNHIGALVKHVQAFTMGTYDYVKLNSFFTTDEPAGPGGGRRYSINARYYGVLDAVGKLWNKDGHYVHSWGSIDGSPGKPQFFSMHVQDVCGVVALVMPARNQPDEW
jgi:hypothetical protein